MSDTFWGRVLYLLERKDISRKEFAHAAGISYSSIHNGNERNSIPNADIALKIAGILDTSIEYLVYGTATQQNQTKQQNDERFLYRKNKELIEALESMPAQAQTSIREMIINLKKVF